MEVVQTSRDVYNFEYTVLDRNDIFCKLTSTTSIIKMTKFLTSIHLFELNKHSTIRINHKKNLKSAGHCSSFVSIFFFWKAIVVIKLTQMNSWADGQPGHSDGTTN